MLAAGIVLALTACGGAASTRSLATPFASMTASSGLTLTATPTLTAMPAPKPNVLSRKLIVGTMERTYRLAEPPKIGAAEQIPLVIVLHPYTSDPYLMAARSGLDALAVDPGWLVAYPAGIGTKNVDSGWNAGACCKPANTAGIDDVGFIGSLLDQLEADYPIDPARVYILGASNGGEMAYRAACEMSDRFAAVANVIGTILVECNATTPVSVIDIHGTADDHIGYDGGGDCQEAPCPSVAETMERWRQADGCIGEPTVTTEGDVVTTSYSTCAGGVEVVFIKVIGKGHDWYTSAPDDLKVIRDFFGSHARPAA